MGGGRDFSGNMIYRRIGGKYQRVQPYKKDFDALIDGLKNEPLIRHEVREILHQFGFKDEQLDYIDQIKIIKERNEMSVGLAKMAMTYGTDMFDRLTVDGEGMDNLTYAHAHIYGNPEINLNPLYFVDGKNHDYKYDVESGFHPKGMDNEMLVEHEYAHLLQRRLSGITQKEELEHAKLSKEIAELEKRRDELSKPTDEENRIYEEIKKYQSLIGTKKYTPDAARELHKLYEQSNELNLKRTREMIQVLNSLSKSKRQDEIAQKVVTANNGHSVIENLFNKAGATSLADVATKLTGRPSAYASKDWGEAHAECVADYMHNGKNASPISIAYVREMNKYFKK